jgi:hypothetical protein
LPDIVAGDRVMPHPLRVIGAFPFIFLLIAVGIVCIWKRMEMKLGRKINLAIGLLLLLNSFNTYHQYFQIWAPMARESDSFIYNITEIAEADYIHEFEGPIYLPLAEYERAVLRYLIGVREVSYLNAFGEPCCKLSASKAMIIIPVSPDRKRLEGPTYKHDPSLFVLLNEKVIYILPPIKDEIAFNLEKYLERKAVVEAIYNHLGRKVATAYIINVDKLPFGKVPHIDNVLNINFGGLIELVGYSISDNHFLPGEYITITVFWRALKPIYENYRIFVHLLDYTQRVRVNADTFPAMGVYPTNYWREGEIITTLHRIKIPLDAQPGLYTVEIGLYQLLTMQRLDVLDSDFQPMGNRILIGPIKIPIGREIPSIRYPLEVDIGDQIKLLGYNLEIKNSAIQITLYWQAKTKVKENYTVFVHLSNERDLIFAQDDGQPREGAYPSSIWEEGEIVPDEHLIPITPAIPSGDYQIWVGMYLLSTGERLKAFDAEGQRLPSDRIPLGKVIVHRH